MEEVYEIHALRFGSHAGRKRKDNFFEMVDDHDTLMPLDYFIWLIRNENRLVVVDTGFGYEEASKRGRTITLLPSERLSQLGVNSMEVDDVVITHLHYDHAGTLRDFPKARFHIQETEMQFATGPWMLEDQERFAYSPEHVAELIHSLFAKRVRFHQDDGEVAPGITVHRMPGHTMGMQSVRVQTQRGWVLLASDASHFYEHWLKRIPFSICWSREDLVSSYHQFEKLAESQDHVIPGHDPMVRQLYPHSLKEVGNEIVRLDLNPNQSLQAVFG